VKSLAWCEEGLGFHPHKKRKKELPIGYIFMPYENLLRYSAS
jgi:hypothetical protein